MSDKPNHPTNPSHKGSASGKHSREMTPERRAALIRRKKALIRARKRRRRRILFGLGLLVFLLILLLAFGISSCVRSHTGSSDNLASKQPGQPSEEEAAAIAAPTATPTPAPISITVSVVGDCTLGTDAYFDYDTSLNNYYDTYGNEYFLQNVKSVFSSDDLTIANFEGTLTESDDRQDKQFAFKAPASFATILTAGSVEAVNTANNHSHDYGEQGFTDTLTALKDQGIVTFGYDETAVMDVKGVKVGLVGIYELNDHLDRVEQLKTNIAKVKADGAQLVIVIFHWGNEKEEVPDSNQTTLGRLAIDEGADLVCGHHPHVLQGIETYKNKQIVYSLGNFCFGGNSYPSDMDSMIYQQTFTVSADGVEPDSNVNILPCSISSDYGYNNYQPTPSEGEEASRILQKIKERSSWISFAESDSRDYFAEASAQ